MVRELWLRPAHSTPVSASTFSQYGTLEPHLGTPWPLRPQTRFNSDCGPQEEESEKPAIGNLAIVDRSWRRGRAREEVTGKARLKQLRFGHDGPRLCRSCGRE